MAELAFTPRSAAPQPGAGLSVADGAASLEKVSLKVWLASGRQSWAFWENRGTYEVEGTA